MIKQIFLKKQDIMVVSHILVSASSIPKILLKSVLIIDNNCSERANQSEILINPAIKVKKLHRVQEYSVGQRAHLSVYLSDYRVPHTKSGSWRS